MSEISNTDDMKEIPKPEAEGYKEIKTESGISHQEAKDYWDNVFDARDESGNFEDNLGSEETDNPESDFEQILEDYFKDLKEKSECPETIPDKPFDSTDLEKRTPEKNAEMREEFDDRKVQLKKEWEEANGRPWPKYKEEVYSSNGKLIRKAGNDYDAHHIQPLGMGGKNEAGNITPLHAEVHYDKQGLHTSDSPYSKLDQMLGGMK